MKNKRLVDFNKEVLCGEIGAIIGAPIIAALAALFTDSTRVIARFAVLGTFLGGSGLFLWKKMQDKKKEGDYSRKSLFKDLSFYTPVAAIIGTCICWPILYHLTKLLLGKDFNSFMAGAISEVTAFSVFLVLINLYRYILVKKFRKEI
jgi:hypothetical protein